MTQTIAMSMSYLSAVNMAHGDPIPFNSSEKTVRVEQVLLDSDKTQSEISRFLT